MKKIYVVGAFGELCTKAKHLTLEQTVGSEGYPVFSTYAHQPDIKFAEARFVQQDDAEEWAHQKNAAKNL